MAIAKSGDLVAKDDNLLLLSSLIISFIEDCFPHPVHIFLARVLALL